MNDHEVARLLCRRADDVFDIEAPVAEVIAAGRSLQRRTRRVTVAGLVLAACVIGGVTVQQATADQTRTTDRSPAAAAPEIQVFNGGNFIERYSSLTAADWVTNADYVVVARATTEQATYSDSSGVVGRSVDLDITEVVWSHPTPSEQLPSTVTVSAWGWAKGNIPMARSGTPRIEPGHDYVIALVWEPTRCAPGDPTEPAHWMQLGSDAVLPFDDARIGYGESAGRLVEGDAGQAGMGTLEERVLGEPLSDLRDALNAAETADSKTRDTRPRAAAC